MKSISILSRVAAYVTAADLQIPLGPFLHADLTIREATELARDAAPKNLPFLKAWEMELEMLFLSGSSEKNPTHFLWYTDLVGGGRKKVRKVATPLEFGIVVAADTPAISLAASLATDSHRSWRLVLTGDRITGFVSRVEMARQEFSIAVLALLLQVEQACIDAMTWDPGDAEAAWNRLKPSRQAKALTVYAERSRMPPKQASEHDLIRCTTFIDKGSMLLGLPDFVSDSRKQLEAKFALMESVRNSLAHGSFCPLEKLLSATKTAEDLLRRLTPNVAPRMKLVVSNDTVQTQDNDGCESETED